MYIIKMERKFRKPSALKLGPSVTVNVSNAQKQPQTNVINAIDFRPETVPGRSSHETPKFPSREVDSGRRAILLI